jgi:hypothetical protein
VFPSSACSASLTPGSILWGVIEGVVPGEDTMPRIRVDRRYGPRVPRPRTRRSPNAALTVVLVVLTIVLALKA